MFELFPHLISISFIYHSSQGNTLRSLCLGVSRFRNSFASQRVKQGSSTAGSCANSVMRALWCQPASCSHRAAGWQQMGATRPSCSSGLARHHTYRYGCDTHTGACTDHSSLLAQKGKGREQHSHTAHTHHQCVHRGGGGQGHLQPPKVHSIVILFCSSSPGCNLTNP